MDGHHDCLISDGGSLDLAYLGQSFGVVGLYGDGLVLDVHALDLGQLRKGFSVMDGHHDCLVSDGGSLDLAYLGQSLGIISIDSEGSLKPGLPLSLERVDLIFYMLDLLLVLYPLIGICYQRLCCFEFL